MPEPTCPACRAPLEVAPADESHEQFTCRACGTLVDPFAILATRGSERTGRGRRLLVAAFGMLLLFVLLLLLVTFLPLLFGAPGGGSGP